MAAVGLGTTVMPGGARLAATGCTYGMWPARSALPLTAKAAAAAAAGAGTGASTTLLRCGDAVATGLPAEALPTPCDGEVEAGSAAVLWERGAWYACAWDWG